MVIFDQKRSYLTENETWTVLKNQKWYKVQIISDNIILQL